MEIGSSDALVKAKHTTFSFTLTKVVLEVKVTSAPSKCAVIFGTLRLSDEDWKQRVRNPVGSSVVGKSISSFTADSKLGYNSDGNIVNVLLESMIILPFDESPDSEEFVNSVASNTHCFKFLVVEVVSICGDQ